MATVRDVQRRLIALGYDVGPAGADPQIPADYATNPTYWP